MLSASLLLGESDESWEVPFCLKGAAAATASFVLPRNNGHSNNPLPSLPRSLSSLADGELYSGTSADFMGRDFAIFRTLGDHHPIRTEQHDSRWLNGKKHFVKKNQHKTGPRIDYHFLTWFFSLERSRSVLHFLSLRSSGRKNEMKSNFQTSQRQTQNSPIGGNWPPAAHELLSSPHRTTGGRFFHRTSRR